MIHANDRFSDAVAAKVGQLETTTDAEVVVVAAERSGSYRDVAQSIAALAALLVLVVLFALPWPVHPVLAVIDMIVVWFVVTWLAEGYPLTASLASRSRRLGQVRRAAAAEFHLEAVHATPHRTGLLVYVSAWEGQVELIPDVGLEARIPRGRWAEVMGELSTQDLDRFLAGLDAVGKVLTQHVPATGERQLRLDDAPRIR
ncbi:MAG TPA: hypothetical protein ENK18_01055 [Deltaproteobacteria bacterium]|nr:hypothetical protein [Deltaproteobacteria bacterium]